MRIHFQTWERLNVGQGSRNQVIRKRKENNNISGTEDEITTHEGGEGVFYEPSFIITGFMAA